MKLTPAQIEVLSLMGDGPSLRECDEVSPQWWVERHGTVYKRTAEALVRIGAVEYCAHWGGQPGILGFRVSKSGREALKLYLNPSAVSLLLTAGEESRTIQAPSDGPAPSFEQDGGR